MSQSEETVTTISPKEIAHAIMDFLSAEQACFDCGFGTPEVTYLEQKRKRLELIVKEVLNG